MSNLNIVEILQIGVIGLGFLLALLSYRLLSQEMKLEGLRPQLIRAIYVFMTFSVVLCVIGLVSQLFPVVKQEPVEGGIRIVAVEPGYTFSENKVGVKVHSVSNLGESVEASIYAPNENSAPSRSYRKGEVIPMSAYGDTKHELVFVEGSGPKEWATFVLREVKGK